MLNNTDQQSKLTLTIAERENAQACIHAIEGDTNTLAKLEHKIINTSTFEAMVENLPAHYTQALKHWLTLSRQTQNSEKSKMHALKVAIVCTDNVNLIHRLTTEEISMLLENSASSYPKLHESALQTLNVVLDKHKVLSERVAINLRGADLRHRDLSVLKLQNALVKNVNLMGAQISSYTFNAKQLDTLKDATLKLYKFALGHASSITQLSERFFGILDNFEDVLFTEKKAHTSSLLILIRLELTRSEIISLTKQCALTLVQNKIKYDKAITEMEYNFLNTLANMKIIPVMQMEISDIENQFNCFMKKIRDEKLATVNDKQISREPELQTVQTEAVSTTQQRAAAEHHGHLFKTKFDVFINIDTENKANALKEEIVSNPAFKK